MANNIYRFRRLKWGDPPARLKVRPAATPAPAGVKIDWDILGIVAGLVVIVALIILATISI